MHRLFIPVPDWLDQSKEFRVEQTRHPSPHSDEFLIQSFNTLYGLSMSDRQVAELTTLFVVLSDSNRFDLALKPLMASSDDFKGWYRKGSGFFLFCPDLSEFIERWVGTNLPRQDERSAAAQSFWAGSSTWVMFFLHPSTEKVFLGLVEQTRNRFAQHCLGLPMTGVWDSRSQAVCRKFQEEFPRVILPWKHGSSDGVTYKFLVRRWKKANGY